MDEVFEVYLTRRGSSGRAPHTRLTLPAAPYQVLDALDRIAVTQENDIYAHIERCPGLECLSKEMDFLGDFRKMLALSERISAMDDAQRTALQGLIKMEAAKTESPLPVDRVLDLAYSTDCCHVVDALNDSQLGGFYAENDFIPGLEDLPDNIFQLLDFDKIGREMRLAEKGVFVERSSDSPGGYVLCHSELKQAPPVPAQLLRPDYIIRYTVQLNPACAGGGERESVTLDLPASREQLDAVLKKLNAASWDDVVFADYDGAIPDLPGICAWFDGIEQPNELAEALKPVVASGQLPKFKAVLEASQCSDLDKMTQIAEHLDEYIFSPNLHTGRDFALSELRCMLDDETVGLPLPHLDVEGFGSAIAEQQNAAITVYGAIERQDGCPIQSLEQQEYGMGVTML